MGSSGPERGWVRLEAWGPSRREGRPGVCPARDSLGTFLFALPQMCWARGVPLTLPAFSLPVWTLPWDRIERVPICTQTWEGGSPSSWVGFSPPRVYRRPPEQQGGWSRRWTHTGWAESERGKDRAATLSVKLSTV